jgi:hypothetical protein
LWPSQALSAAIVPKKPRSYQECWQSFRVARSTNGRRPSRRIRIRAFRNSLRADSQTRHAAAKAVGIGFNQIA